MCKLGNEEHEQSALNSLFFNENFDPCICVDNIELEY